MLSLLSSYILYVNMEGERKRDMYIAYCLLPIASLGFPTDFYNLAGDRVGVPFGERRSTASSLPRERRRDEAGCDPRSDDRAGERERCGDGDGLGRVRASGGILNRQWAIGYRQRSYTYMYMH